MLELGYVTSKLRKPAENGVEDLPIGRVRKLCIRRRSEYTADEYQKQAAETGFETAVERGFDAGHNQLRRDACDIFQDVRSALLGARGGPVRRLELIADGVGFGARTYTRRTHRSRSIMQRRANDGQRQTSYGGWKSTGAATPPGGWFSEELRAERPRSGSTAGGMSEAIFARASR
ncbi:MAG: hypothetical protein K8H88_26280, partial [Sandaracinaceae bacterium]|nr:hypothetical protein [Sandaracinaceae bacterium]